MDTAAKEVEVAEEPKVFVHSPGHDAFFVVLIPESRTRNLAVPLKKESDTVCRIKVYSKANSSLDFRHRFPRKPQNEREVGFPTDAVTKEGLGSFFQNFARRSLSNLFQAFVITALRANQELVRVLRYVLDVAVP